LTASSALGAAVSAGHAATGRPDLTDPAKFLSDGISQLTMGSFQVGSKNNKLLIYANEIDRLWNIFFYFLPQQLNVSMIDLQSVHSNAVEKNRILYTLLQHGVETTVDR
jgi:hypothetical protein